MKNQLKFRFVFLVFLSMFLSTIGIQDLHGQNAKKKNKLRLKANYVKIIDGEVYLDMKATSKIEKRNTGVSNIDITIYNEYEDEKIKLGSTTTDMHGKSRFELKSLDALKSDSTDTYNLVVSFKGNDSFKKASKSISFKDVDIRAKIITNDSINYIKATLMDVASGSPLVDQSLDVQVKRLFMPLKIGKEFNHTDENGTIIVPIEEGIPGIDGNLTIEVVLDDSDEFGTVKMLVNAPLGTAIVNESTFDQRTMWSSSSKTPIFILVFTNLLIFGIWGLIIYLIINLFKILKSVA